MTTIPPPAARRAGSQPALPVLDQLPGAVPAGQDGPGLSPDRRRTLRQAAALAAGHHPLGMYLRRTLRLHPDAAPAGDRKAPGARCRDCHFWQQISGDHAGVYRKCVFSYPARASYSAATDCRGWWPACTDYQPQPAAETAATEESP